jgi:hypothetical protein
LVNSLSKVLARRYILNVHKDAARATERGELIADTARIGGGVFAPVADEDV